MSSPQVWFITGASSGLGKSMTEYALSRGDRVVATLRNPSALSTLTQSYPVTQLLTLKLDVTRPTDITSAFSRAKAAFGRIDIVYNNAGFTVLGEVEGTPEEESRRLFEVDFWGAVNVSREAVRFFREENGTSGGRLINVSTLAAIKPTPGIGFYGASRAAFEVVSESLAQELDPSWNIKLTILVLGPFTTEATGTSLVTLPIHPAYTTPPTLPSHGTRQWLSSSSFVGDDPNKAVVRIFNLAKENDPPVRMVLSKVAIGAVKAQAQSYLDTSDKYADRSERLGFDEKEPEKADKKVEKKVEKKTRVSGGALGWIRRLSLRMKKL